jgi:hypothetical protein
MTRNSAGLSSTTLTGTGFFLATRVISRMMTARIETAHRAFRSLKGKDMMR